MGRFTGLVYSLENREAFKAKYGIPAEVTIRHCELEEWYTKRAISEVAVPMIAFIKGGITIPMGRVMKELLILYGLCPTQCSLNLFRVLDSVDRLNEKMDVNLTHHDVNWVYSFQNSKDTGFYLRTRVLVVCLISCLPETKKGMDKEFLIISGDWHHGLHCPTREGTPGRGSNGSLGILVFSSAIHFIFIL